MELLNKTNDSIFNKWYSFNFNGEIRNGKLVSVEQNPVALKDVYNFVSPFGNAFKLTLEEISDHIIPEEKNVTDVVLSSMSQVHKDTHKLIEFDWLITNGFPIYDKSFTGRFEKGWKVACTIPAKSIHPHSADTDMATIFVKYTPYPKDDDIHESAQ